MLYNYIVSNDNENFLKTIEQLNNVDYISNILSLYHLAVEKNSCESLHGLFKLKSPDFEELCKLGEIAVERSNFDALSTLLAKNSKIANKLILQACQELVVPSKSFQINYDNRIRCLKLILEQKNVNVRQEDGKLICIYFLMNIKFIFFIKLP